MPPVIASRCHFGIFVLISIEKYRNRRDSTGIADLKVQRIMFKSEFLQNILFSKFFKTFLYYIRLTILKNTKMQLIESKS